MRLHGSGTRYYPYEMYEVSQQSVKDIVICARIAQKFVVATLLQHFNVAYCNTMLQKHVVKISFCNITSAILQQYLKYFQQETQIDTRVILFLFYFLYFYSKISKKQRQE